MSELEFTDFAPTADNIGFSVNGALDVMRGCARMGAKVHEHGFVYLVDMMPRLVQARAGSDRVTGDSAVVQAARVSYGGGEKTPKEDAALIRYLMRHQHTTPFEMCLAGDTRIPTMPCPGAQRKTYTIREIAEAFANPTRENASVRLVHVRTVDADGTIRATRVKFAKCTGRKPTFRVKTAGPLSREIVVTDNHPILTPNGYRDVRTLRVGDQIMANGAAVASAAQLRELWSDGATLLEVAELLGVSRTTAFRRLRDAGVNTAKRTGWHRKSEGTHNDPRAIARRVCTARVCCVCGHPAAEVHHLDENPHNNDPANLAAVCRVCHKAFHNDPFQLCVYATEIVSIEPSGVQDVYDLEVEDANHNFVAEGIVVHNCEFKFHVSLPIFIARQWIRHRTANVNEVSARYTELPDKYYLPGEWRRQSTSNKQGGEETMEYIPPMAYLDTEERMDTAETAEEIALREYHARLKAGVSRELARTCLPVSMYTEWYWKCDLHNLLRFLALRSDSHAQKEIRDYADVMIAILDRVVPVTMQAWRDYVVDSVRLSAPELKALRRYLRTLLPDNVEVPSLESGNERENTEWTNKFRQLLE